MSDATLADVASFVFCITLTQVQSRISEGTDTFAIITAMRLPADETSLLYYSSLRLSDFRTGVAYCKALSLPSPVCPFVNP